MARHRQMEILSSIGSEGQMQQAADQWEMTNKDSDRTH